MKGIKAIGLLALVMCVLFITFGCGGGGGGGDGGASGGINYTGLDTRALIDDKNAERLALGVYAGGDISADFIMIGAVQNNEPEINSFNLFFFSQQIMDVMLNVDFDPQSYGTYIGAIQDIEDIEGGSCLPDGGNYVINLSFDDQTGDFNGTIKFNNYCEDNVTINGPSTFSGTIDPFTLEFSDFIITFNNVSSSDGVETVILKGDMALIFNPLSSTATINSLIEYSSTGKVFKLRNYQMDLSEGSDGGGDFAEVVLSGKYYDPDYGYVDIITSTPLKIYFLDMFPSEGVFILDGANGVAGGSTKARFTALNNTSYMIEADTTGDDAYDYNSDPINWP